MSQQASSPSPPPPPPPEDDPSNVSSATMTPLPKSAPPVDHYANIMTEASTQIHDPSQLRKSLGFTSPEKLRERAVATLLGNVYQPPTHGADVPHEAMGTQTDALGVRETAAGPGDTDLGPPERTISLSVDLPSSQDFPILSAAQLIEAERRVMDLITRLEAELIRATEEEERQVKLGRERAMMKDTHKAALGFKSTAEWNQCMAEKLKKRLRIRYDDPAEASVPFSWYKEKEAYVLSPVRHRNPQKLLESSTISPARSKYEHISFISASAQHSATGQQPKSTPTPNTPSTTHSSNSANAVDKGNTPAFSQGTPTPTGDSSTPQLPPSVDKKGAPRQKGEWKELQDDKGRTYYFNVNSRKTTWKVEETSFA